MALKQNGRLINQLPLRFRGGSTTSFEYSETNKSSLRNIFAGEAGIDPDYGSPAGATYPGAWNWPQRSGGLSSFTKNGGVATVTGSGQLGINISSSVAGVATTSATGNVTTESPGSSSGSATVSGSLGAAVFAVASSAGQATVSGQIGAVVVASATVNGAATVSAAIIGLGDMGGDITPFTELSPQSLAQQLLDNEDIETSFSLREAMRIILSVNAGKLSGAGTSSISIRDINDSKNRVVATVDSSGNRSSVTLDGA